MLAYVFWHSRSSDVGPHEYERALVRFHEALAAAPPPGFAGSSAHAVDGIGWLAGDAYEDWYIVERWDDLGALNETAVDARRAATHDAAARIVRDGVAGIYRLRAGGEPLPSDGDALWTRKPRGVPYDEFRAALAPLGAALWQRQMVLGPAPEFCVLAPSAGAALARATHVRRRAVFP